MMMKSRFLFFGLLCALVMFSACDKDDDCMADNLSAAIVGSWNVRALSMTLGRVEFQADGTLIDDDDILVGGEINGMPLDQKSWTVTGDELLSVEATNGNASFGFDFDVLDYSCDEILLDVFGIETRLLRR